MNTWREPRGFPLAGRHLLVHRPGVTTGCHLLVPWLVQHLSANLGLSAAVRNAVIGRSMDPGAHADLPRTPRACCRGFGRSSGALARPHRRRVRPARTQPVPATARANDV